MERVGSSHDNAVVYYEKRHCLTVGQLSDGILRCADLTALYAVRRCTSAVRDTASLPE